jgi:hypothetical protein
VPQFTTSGAQPFGSLNKGINRDAPRTAIPEGYYEDALNMIFYSSANGGQHLASCKPDALLDPLLDWPTGQLVWFAPFTYSSFDDVTGILSFNTHILTRRSTGTYYRYDVGNPGTNTLVRRFITPVPDLTTHNIFDQWLLTFDAVNSPMKYGQHFFFDGQEEPRPYLFPIGSKPVSPLIGTGPVGETWTYTGTSATVADASVPGGGARVGTHSIKLGPSDVARIQFAATRDLRASPQPYGSTVFDDADFLQWQWYKAANDGGTLAVRFYKTYNTVHRTYSVIPATTGAWKLASVLGSNATDVGGFVDADMATITDVELINSDAVNDAYVDDLYFLYADAPPAGQVGTAHKDRIIIGGVPVAGDTGGPALATLFYSNSAEPDIFPAANFQIISGGSSSLARANRVTVLREYGDTVVVGMQNAIFAWTIGTDGAPSRSVVTTETGIDSPRAVVETPAGSLIFPWQRGFYILRQTGRSYVADKIAPIIEDIWLEEPWWTVGIRDERTRTIRFWFREKPLGADDPTVTTRGVIFDYARSQELGESVWVSQMDQMADHAVEAFVSGKREVLYARFTQAGIFRLGSEEGGPLLSSVTLPWTAIQSRDKVTKWVGMVVPYGSMGDVRVFTRYASNPAEFATAQFAEVDSLAANPTITDQGRVYIGDATRWVQVKLQSQQFGMEIYPPIELISLPTERPA